MLMATVCKTWAPRGHTPTIPYRYHHGKVSVISGLSVSARRHQVGLYYAFHDQNIRHAQVCEFLRHVLRHLRGEVIVIWDNAAIHKGEAIRAFCAQHRRVHLEYLPGYAPELNPDEGVWNQAKKALANGRPNDTEALREQVATQLEKLSESPASLRACIHDSELPVFLR